MTPIKLSEARRAVAALRAVDLGADRLGHDELWATVLEQSRGTDTATTSLQRLGRRMPTVIGLRATIERNRETASPALLAEVDALAPAPVSCELCNDARFVRVPDPQRVSGMGVAPCSCVELDQPEFLVERSGIPSDYLGMCFENFRAVEGKRDALDWMLRRDPQRSVVLHGPWGRGKTHLGVAALSAAAEGGLRGRYVYVPDLLDGIRERYDDDVEESAADYTEALLTVPLLLLDDLSAARWTEWARERITVILDRRLREKRATIVTTNYSSAGEVADEIAPSIASRLGAYDWLKVGGDDMRGA